MKKIVLIMGHIASLKTTIAKRLSNELHILCFCKDDVKEILGDTIGFSNREENLKLSKATFYILKDIANHALDKDVPLILESNFKHHELDMLKADFDGKKIDFLTLFFTGNDNMLYQRYVDRQKFRHQVHTSAGLMSIKTFKESMMTYMPEKLLGKSFLIDTTTYDENDYHHIKDIVKQFLNKNNI